ncbi:MATE family efflux transporter [Lysobacter sp. GX 14042]|uniref:MATE family efflux transporter n=1 Tax=Lysobacter sp. GX 14042 TaxID=2907155 RepID=UPI001F2DB6C3|nr:MATE family efflux transporter [Lysobacter sp. GX 14042]MCE7032988.1 MATE family efflux transporter [Lysobacter sp. GX 14042]
MDFTRGSIPPKLFRFSLPILLANLLQASMQLVNGLWVGNLLGSEAFAAVTVGTTLLVVVLAFVLGMNNATLTIFAQLRGAGDGRAIDAYLGGFVLILGVLSLIVGVAGHAFAESLLVVLNTPAPIMEEARGYLQVSFLGTVFLVGYNFIGTMLRAFGDSRTPLYFVLLATVLAAIITPLLIVGRGMGVNGAAWAVVLAQAAAFLYSLWYLARSSGRYRLRPQRPKFAQLRTILELGIPSGVQMIVIYAGMTVILSLVNAFGADVVAGFGAAQRLDSIILLPAIALGTAVNAMAAQNIGAGQWGRVEQISRVGVLHNVGVMTAIAVVLLVWAEPLVRLFIRDEGSVAFGVSYLRTIALFYPFLGLNFIFNGVVRGSGAMVQVLALNIISLWILRVPLAYWMASLYGERGIALGMGIGFLLSSLFSAAYYRWGGWRDRQLFRESSAPAGPG